MQKINKFIIVMVMVLTLTILSSCDALLVPNTPGGNVTNDNPLTTALTKLNNFSVTYDSKITSTEVEEYSSTLKYDGLSLYRESSDTGTLYKEYLTTVNNVKYYYGQYEDETWFKIPASNELYEMYESYFEIFNIDSLKTTDFILSGTDYVPVNGQLQNIGKAVFGDFSVDGNVDTFTDFKITVTNNLISKIYVASNYIDNSVSPAVTSKYEYTLTFSNYGLISLTLPTATEYEEADSSIVAAYEAADNSTVDVEGYVSAIIGNNVYIYDGTKGIYLYLGNNTAYASILIIGNGVKVSGTKTTFKGLVEISDITSLIAIDDTKLYEALVLNDLSKTSLDSNVSSLVSFNEATLVSKPDTMSNSSDISITISDGTNETTLFISRHVDDGLTDEIIALIEGLEVGATFNIENVVVSYYNNPQLAVADSTLISVPTEDITPIDSQYPTNMKTIKDQAKNATLTTGLPAVGDSKVLVMPVAFTDKGAPSDILSVLETSFFGTAAETGYESLASYYQKVSYGKLNISGTVLPVFNTGKASTYYSDKYDDGDDSIDYEIIKAALEYYNDTVDYSDYDSDSDGYIDAIYIVYTADVTYDTGSELWWAYTYEYCTEDYEYYDEVEADYYTFLGYDFFTEAIKTYENASDDVYINNNALTIIHETGHLLGLDDYYDYDIEVGPAGGIGGGDMMDFNIGDHNAYSKAILGWVTPYVVCGKDTNVTLKSFEKSGECVIIAKNWNGSYFSEYLIIDYYTPTGVNELFGGYNGLFSTSGIRIYHIDATPTTDTADSMWTLTKYNNSDTAHKLIKLIQADGYGDIEDTSLYEEGGWSDDADLFTLNSTYQHRWYNGTDAGFTLKVTSMNTEEATISIDYE